MKLTQHSENSDELETISDPFLCTWIIFLISKFMTKSSTLRQPATRLQDSCSDRTVGTARRTSHRVARESSNQTNATGAGKYSRAFGFLAGWVVGRHELEAARIKWSSCGICTQWSPTMNERGKCSDQHPVEPFQWNLLKHRFVRTSW